MTNQELRNFANLVRNEADSLLSTWRAEVAKMPSAEGLSVPVLNDHIPSLIEELAVAFETRSDESITEALIAGSPVEHGVQRVADGFEIVEVVAEYNILRGCLYDLGVTHGLHMTGRGFHILNRVFDGAIGLAVESYAEQRAREVQQRREEYLAFVAHDLRTPLQAVALAASVLEDTGSTPLPTEERAHVYRTLQRNIDKLRGLVKKVLEENKNVLTEGKLKLQRRQLDLWPVVEELVHDMKPLGGIGSTVLLNSVPQDLVVYADVGLLRRIFQNLISNAITYTPDGTVSIGAQERTEEEIVECWVSDTGRGIPTHLLGHVFQSGEGDDERAESKGLGLAIVKTFVEEHGGAVHAESIQGKGTTIRFTLPMLEA